MKNRKMQNCVAVILTMMTVFMMTTGVFAAGGDGGNTGAEAQNTTSSQVASPDEMAAPQAVGSDDMTPVYAAQIEDGQYEIEVESSSSMFRIVNAALTVENGGMKAVVTLSGKGYGKLFMGTAQEAAAADESLFIPYVEDGNGAYTYEIPVDALNQVIPCAAWSIKKEKWYDRDLVFLSDGIPADKIDRSVQAGQSALEDGNYRIDVLLSGGSGKASVKSPAPLTVKDGVMTVRLEWSSSNYNYMIVGGVRYEPVNTDGNSVFEFPVSALDEEIEVTADTTAMSTPHEIDYVLTFDSKTAEPLDQEETKNDADAGDLGDSETEMSEKGSGSGMVAAAVVIVLLIVIVVLAVVVVLLRRKRSGRK